MIISRQQVKLYLRLSISIGILGILFKILHYPYGSVLLVLGIAGIAVFYFIRFYLKHPKTILDYSKLILIISFLLHYSFRVFHLPYTYVFTLLTQMAFVVFLILYARDVLFLEHENKEGDNETTKPSVRKKTVSYFLYGLAAIGIILGAQFKILHWEFAWLNGNILLAIGLLSAVASLFVDIGHKDS